MPKPEQTGNVGRLLGSTSLLPYLADGDCEESLGRRRRTAPLPQDLCTLHEEGVSVNTIRIRLGHESLDVTLAYLKGKDAESEEAQEHANSSSLALYA